MYAPDDIVLKGVCWGLLLLEGRRGAGGKSMYALDFLWTFACVNVDNEQRVIINKKIYTNYIFFSEPAPNCRSNN